MLACVPELEQAAQTYLAYDRDLDVTSADADAEEARRTQAALADRLQKAAENVSTREPKTLAGLLAFAQARPHRGAGGGVLWL